MLTGCATLPPQDHSLDSLNWEEHVAEVQAINQWHLQGKIGIQAPQASGSANLEWRQQAEQFSLSMSGPLGLGTSKIEGDALWATLYYDGKVYSAPTNELAFDLTGLPFTMDMLTWWVRGLPIPNDELIALELENGYAKQFQQHGWQLSFARYQTTPQGRLPGKIVISKPDHQIKLVINQWHLTTP